MTDIEDKFIKEFSDLLSIIPRCNIDETKTKLNLTFEGISKDIKFQISKKEIIALSKSLLKCDKYLETEYKCENYYEIMINRKTNSFAYRAPFHIEEKGLIFEDKVNKINYEISGPSDEFILFILKKFKENDIDFRHLSRMSPTYFLRRLDKKQIKKMSIFDLLSMMARIRVSLKIKSEANHSIDELNKLTTSLLYELSHNTERVFLPLKSLDEFSRYERFRRIRRVEAEDMEAPKRRYNSDLVHHYQMAMSSDNPLIQFLSYYQIMEYFYESVYEDELINQIKTEITKPDFSYKRKKDVRKIISLIKNKFRSNKETSTVNEQEALNLTLSKYVRMNELKSKLEDYDEDIIDFFKNNKVSFSQGNIFNINGNDPLITFKDISKRIYKTRNSIVHNKESKTEKYIPFKHEKILGKEIPLMRFIAEELLFSTSKILYEHS